MKGHKPRYAVLRLPIFQHENLPGSNMDDMQNSTYGALKPTNRHNECPQEMFSCLTNTLPAREPHATTKLARVTQGGIVLSSSDRGFGLLCQNIKCFTTPRSCQLLFIDDQLLHSAGGSALTCPNQLTVTREDVYAPGNFSHVNPTSANQLSRSLP